LSKEEWARLDAEYDERMRRPPEVELVKFRDEYKAAATLLYVLLMYNSLLRQELEEPDPYISKTA
jgi:hypothetical protein